jgi:regulatory protein
MRRHLARQGIEAGAAGHAIQTLIDDGYLDDVRFATAFTHDKRELEQWGSERIERALLDRGIDRDLVRETLGATPCEPELDRALGLLRRRFPKPPSDRRERDRALGVLLRKGYDGDLALDALAAYARGIG